METITESKNIERNEYSNKKLKIKSSRPIINNGLNVQQLIIEDCQGIEIRGPVNANLSVLIKNNSSVKVINTSFTCESFELNNSEIEGSGLSIENAGNTNINIDASSIKNIRNRVSFEADIITISNQSEVELPGVVTGNVNVDDGSRFDCEVHNGQIVNSK